MAAKKVVVDGEGRTWVLGRVLNEHETYALTLPHEEIVVPMGLGFGDTLRCRREGKDFVFERDEGEKECSLKIYGVSKAHRVRFRLRDIVDWLGLEHDDIVGFRLDGKRILVRKFKKETR